MKISKAQAQENRERIVGAASTLFRERGFDGVSVGDLSKAAGFTHGGFYNHFASKDALAARALESAFASMAGHREREETVKARRLYERQGWPVIDVTRRSVEETAAAVLNLLHGGHGQVEVLG